MSDALEIVAAKLQDMPASERAGVVESALRLTSGFRWAPLPGPQLEAFFSPADLLYYGGQGGGGKSDLLIGLGLTQHRSSLIMRRQYVDLSALTDRALAVYGSRKGFSGAPPPRLTTDDGNVVDFGAASKPGDEQSWQGRPHDFLGVDEACQMQEGQVRYLMGWVRTTVKGQRTRVVFASNPPLTAEGEWLTRMFAP